MLVTAAAADGLHTLPDAGSDVDIDDGVEEEVDREVHSLENIRNHLWGNKSRGGFSLL